MLKKVSNKNGLVELFRFLCSVWVAYFHGFFFILSDKFDGVNISIDFFFMVSGLFFLKSMEKYKEKSFLEGTKFIFWNKIKGFVVPLIIAALSVLCCNILFEFEFNKFNWPLSFLWFFLAQFVYLSIFYLLFKKIQRRSIFNLACVLIVCFSMSFVLFKNETIYRVARGLAMISFGIFVSQIPKIKIKLKNEATSEKLGLIINVLGFVMAAIAFVYLAYLPGYTIWKLYIFTCVVCTSLLYFATALPVRSKFLNLLGEISIFIYLAQCPILLHYYGGIRNTTDQFPWLCFYAVVLFVINRIVNTIIKRRKALA
jgi:hypothetical protein